MAKEQDRSEELQTLPDDAARRLLARASEIESAQSNELTVAELREAAREAGIAPNAFDKALVELRDRSPVADSEPVKPAGTSRSRFATGLLNSLKTVGLVLVTLLVLMILVDLFG